MDKPLFYVGSAYLFCLMFCAGTGFWFPVATLAVSFGVFLWLCYRWQQKRKRKQTGKQGFFAAVALTVFLAALFFVLQTKLTYEPALAMAGKEVELQGYVEEVLPDSSTGAHRCVLRVEGVPSVKRVRLSSKHYMPELNDQLSFSGTLYALGEGDAAVRNYYKSQGWYLGVTTKETLRAEGTEPGPLRTFLSWMSRGKALLSKQVEQYLPPVPAGVLTGMLVGDTSSMSEDIQTVFRKTGVLHLFAVSGFHVALWSALVYKLLLRLGLSRNPVCLGTMLFILLFVALTGFSKSALRAGVMLAVFFGSRMLVRSHNALNALGLAALVVLLPNPFYGGDTGLLLSFFATLGILVGYPALMDPVHRALKERMSSHRARKFLEQGLGLTIASLCAFVFTLPVVMRTFGSASLLSPLSSLLVTTASSAGIFLTGVGCVGSLLPGLSLLAPWCFLGAGSLARYMVAVLSGLSKLPFAMVGLQSEGVRLGVAGAMALAAVAFVLDGTLRKDKLPFRRMAALLCVICLLGSSGAELLLSQGVIKVHFPDVPGNLCCITYRKEAVVIGAGEDGYESARALEDILEREEVKTVSALILPRSEKADTGGQKDLENALVPRQVLEPDRFRGEASQTLTLFPEVTLTLFKDGETPAFALLQVQGVRLTLLFRPTVSASLLPELAQNAPIFYCRRNLPEDLSLPSSSYIIVSGKTGPVEARVRNASFALFSRPFEQ